MEALGQRFQLPVLRAGRHSGVDPDAVQRIHREFFHLLPADLAFSAGMGDILTAVFAWPVAKWVSQSKPWSIKAVYAWNIFGILDIVTLLTIVGITINKSIISGANGDLQEMTLFPFSWFPAFAPATILFLHTAIFRKLQQIKAR